MPEWVIGIGIMGIILVVGSILMWIVDFFRSTCPACDRLGLRRTGAKRDRPGHFRIPRKESGFKCVYCGHKIWRLEHTNYGY